MSEAKRSESGAGEAGANLTELLCAGLLFGGDCDVPKAIAICPECGDTLHAEAQEFDTETGSPTIGGLVIYCNSDPFCSTHKMQYYDWVPVKLRVDKYFGAVST